MHTITIRTKFTFGDRVRFNSPIQGCSGVGKIWVITVGGDGYVDYMIELDGSGDLQPGITEQEITLLEDNADLSDR
jgi:hypothetical protein